MNTKTISLLAVFIFLISCNTNSTCDFSEIYIYGVTLTAKTPIRLTEEKFKERSTFCKTSSHR